MNNPTINLFVYGTLMPGAWNYPLIERHVLRSSPGTIAGVLVDLGSIPALTHGEGLVRGTLLEVDPVALAITDRLEGHPMVYVRRQTTVRREDGTTVAAFVYEYADPARIAHRPHLICEYDGDVPMHAWRGSECRRDMMLRVFVEST